jgi:hypothetical protein
VTLSGRPKGKSLFHL